MAFSDPFDPDRLRLPDNNSSMWPQVSGSRRPRRKSGDLFLKGPIPWSWLQRAADLPGRALAVGLVIWHLHGLRKSRTVRVTQSQTRSLGLSPRVARRGLATLETAGLVSVNRHRGRGPDVTVLDAPVATSV